MSASVNVSLEKRQNADNLDCDESDSVSELPQGKRSGCQIEMGIGI